jgi:endonuclease/exonuclease/phosphatase family metal-dependent hydrolase
MQKIGILFALFFSLAANAQEQATIMCYNVLNFPTSNLAGREDTLRQLVNYIEPDIFLMQELKNDSGLQLILNESFADLPANYAASTFLAQQSNPANSYKLQQAMVYNSDMFGLAKEGFVQTVTRDINRFKMFYRDPELSTGADTVFLYVHVTHLKSSQGTSNQEERLSNVQSFTTSLGNLPADANVILAGDFNVYDSAEPAYQELLDSTNAIRMRDPIDSPGDWSSSSFQPKDILTQSTRSSSIFGDGAGGGLDDRFDFILVSDNMMQSSNTVVFEAESYYAMGNSGTCYNQNITDCSGGEWSDEILQSLYYMSDHLPVIMTLNLSGGSVGIENEQAEITPLLWANESLRLDWRQEETLQITVTDLLGRVWYQAQHAVLNGANTIVLPEVANMKGLMLISVSSSTEQHTLKVVR